MNKQLEAACRDGNEANVEALIKQGADGFRFGLHAACKAGHISIVRRLLPKIEDEDDRCVCGLQTACRFGNLELVEFLIKDGGLNKTSFLNEGMYAACRSGQKRIVELLLSKGADDLNGALENLANFGFGDYRIIGMLLKLGATNAADVFDASVGYDASYVLQRLLVETDAPRSSLKGVKWIDYAVFAPLDRFVGAVRVELADAGWPDVLQTIVAEYCVNLS